MKYAKGVLALLGLLATLLMGALAGDEHVDPSEASNMVVQGLGALGVLFAANLAVRVWVYTKTILAAVTAFGVGLISALTDDVGDFGWNLDVSTTEGLQVLVAVLVAIGVYAAPNAVSVRPVGHPG